MNVEHGETIEIPTKGFSDVIDISREVERVVGMSGISEGTVCVTCIGSTASVTTLEYEPALVLDLQELLEGIASADMRSRHSETWGDDNGFSHLRAALMGPGITIPVSEGRPILGTWQQVVVVDHDNRPRSRKVRIQVSGE